MPVFTIKLHLKDLNLLNRIQSFFGVGTIYIDKSRGSATYSVSRLKDFTNVIIPHFDNNPLSTQKQADFKLFKMVIELINQKEHLTAEGLNKILSIKASLNRGLSEELMKSFPNITPIERPVIEPREILDPN
jgi:hypothetical protein